MSPLSKVWAKWLLVGQYANVVAMLLMAFAATTTEIAWLASWKQHALEIHATVTGLIGTLQAMAKALPDSDGDGKPDLFDAAPTDPSA